MREKILFDNDWLFHKGDIRHPLPTSKGPMYSQSKTERMLWGPAAIRYNADPDQFFGDKEVCTDTWEYVTLPHDYTVNEIPSKENNCALGFLPYRNAWYRKTFFIGDDDKGKRFILFFEAVATECTVYLNGCVLKRNFSGYNSFEVDISDFVKFGENNVLAVYVNAENHEGWWYEGAGIYRHVWLIKTGAVAIDTYGVYAMPVKIGDNLWHTDVQTEIVNDSYNSVTVCAETVFYDKNGREVAKGSGNVTVPERERGVARYPIDMQSPELWDIENPVLYSVVTTLFADGSPVDEYRTHTGFREFRADSEKGLFLNGKPVKIKGVCAHQDFGITGRAVADNVQKYKIRLLKEMSANGYRTSHYPHGEATMDALDEMGFIVMDEVRWFDSSEYGKEYLEMMIKRDRNRPSVFLWSIGNEEPHHKTEEGRRICKNLMAFAKKLDDTRLVTSAVDRPDGATVYDELDAIGVNYNLGIYEKLHQKYPEKPIYASECCATGTTRGWYDDYCKAKSYISAYDKDTNDYFLGREKTWKFLDSHDWIMGGYQWNGFDYRGESTWPRLCSQSGSIDLFLQKKDAFYQDKSHWAEEPLVHLLPHWNFRGREGEPIKVWAYTNCQELELFLNGESQGVRRIEKHGHGEWFVPYEPGEIKVIGKNDGKTVCSDVQKTSKAATGLCLRLENGPIHANGQDVAVVTCYCTDEDGLEVPDAAPTVEFHTNSLGEVIGTGSDISDHTPPCCTVRKMRAGRITVAVRAGNERGEMTLYAVSDGLTGAALKIDLK